MGGERGRWRRADAGEARGEERGEEVGRRREGRERKEREGEGTGTRSSGGIYLEVWGEPGSLSPQHL